MSNLGYLMTDFDRVSYLANLLTTRATGGRQIIMSTPVYVANFYKIQQYHRKFHLLSDTIERWILFGLLFNPNLARMQTEEPSSLSNLHLF